MNIIRPKSIGEMNVANEWINIKDKFPDFGEVVEIYVSDRLNGVKLDHAAYMKDDGYSGKNYWTMHGMDEDSWSDKGFGIKYWRHLAPLPNGTKPYFQIDKRGY